MASISIILGKQGTGKSTSIKTLNPEETIVINVLGKRLPFKGSNAVYNALKGNSLQLDEYSEIINALVSINNKAPHVKTIIIDDCIYIMRKEYFKRSGETGYKKYSDFGAHFQQIIATCESLREDLNIFLMLHSEDVISDKVITTYKAATVGNLVDSTYNPLEVVTVVLYSDVKFDEEGKPNYGFYTNKTMDGQALIPAKSPEGMFDSLFIPNDLAYVIKSMENYYN